MHCRDNITTPFLPEATATEDVQTFTAKALAGAHIIILDQHLEFRKGIVLGQGRALGRALRAARTSSGGCC